jgi:hypothetical protein
LNPDIFKVCDTFAGLNLVASSSSFGSVIEQRADHLSPSTMVFTSPSWVPQMPFDPPDSVSIPEFLFNDQSGRYPLAKARPCFVCGITGKSYSAVEVKQRIEYLARGLKAELGWNPNEGSEWDKVAGAFSANCVRHR